MGQKNNDGKTVDESKHDRVWNEPDELAPFHDSDCDLDKAHEDNGGKKVFYAVCRHERDHDNSKGTRRSRNHPGTTTENGGDKTDDERCVEADKRVNAGHKCEGHSLGHKGQRYGEAGKQFCRHLSGVCRANTVFQIGKNRAAGQSGHFHSGHKMSWSFRVLAGA